LVEMAHQCKAPGAKLAQQCKAPKVTEAMTVQRVETESQDRKERKGIKECKGIEVQGGRKEIKETTANKDRWVTGELRAHAENMALLARKVYKDRLDRRVNTGLQAVRARWVIKGRKEIKER